MYNCLTLAVSVNMKRKKNRDEGRYAINLYLPKIWMLSFKR